MPKSPQKVAPTRDRILKAAKHLFQQRGYYAVGTAEILAEAKAPKGSMYHHFPEGKEQIAIEVVKTIRSDVIGMMQALEDKPLSVADTIRVLSKGMTHWLIQSKWREGSMLASATVGSVPDLPKVHAAIRDAFDEWHQHIGARLVREGWRKSAAHTMSQTIIAAIEGAMILARIDQDAQVISKVTETVARMVDAGDAH